jgi:hypothetical protein
MSDKHVRKPKQRKSNLYPERRKEEGRKERSLQIKGKKNMSGSSK